MLPVLVGQRTVTLLREGNILNSEDRIKVTRDDESLCPQTLASTPHSRRRESLARKESGQVAIL